MGHRPERVPSVLVAALVDIRACSSYQHHLLSKQHKFVALDLQFFLACSCLPPYLDFMTTLRELLADSGQQATYLNGELNDSQIDYSLTIRIRQAVPVYTIDGLDH